MTVVRSECISEPRLLGRRIMATLGRCRRFDSCKHSYAPTAHKCIVTLYYYYRIWAARTRAGTGIFYHKRDIMSITVNIYYTGKNGAARQFAEEMISSGIVSQVRAEEGNERYEYFFPADDPETVLLIDRWRDEDAISVHHKSDMMVKIAALRDKYRLRMKIEKYTDLPNEKRR